MTLTNIVIKAKPPQVQGFYPLLQKPTNCNSIGLGRNMQQLIAKLLPYLYL